MDSYSYLPHHVQKFWKKYKELFKVPINNIKELNTIFFNGKTKFFDKIDKKYKSEGEKFIKYYKELQKLALNLENVLPEKIRLLKKGTNGKNELTRKEAALIFLLSFFNFIDIEQEKKCDRNQFTVYQVLSFSRNTEFEFGRCFLNYLTIIGKWLSENNPILEEKIIYIRGTRRFSKDIYKEKKNLCDIKIYEKGSLFDGDASFCIDFANKYIGGGVLEGGCVQEEILFAIEPEAIVSMFFMEVMGDNDAIRIDNTIQYSNYLGYGHTFEFEKSAINDDLKNIKKTKFIAIDASVQFSSKHGIIDKNEISRDTYKAFVGFNLANYKIEPNNTNNEKEEKNKNKKEKNKEQKEEKENIKNNGISIATGNWGCGAFNGDHELKFLQQWVAASFAGIERLDYYTYNSEKMKFVIKKLEQIKEKYENANNLYKDLLTKHFGEGEVLEVLLGEENIEKNDNDDCLII